MNKQIYVWRNCEKALKKCNICFFIKAAAWAEVCAKAMKKALA